MEEKKPKNPFGAACRLCPRECGAHRLQGPGLCGGTAPVRVARAAPHFWEEPCISGNRGSGAVFFTGCPLRCAFCQNRALWPAGAGRPLSQKQLANIFLRLQAQGVHNLNLVTAGHWQPAVQEALAQARRAGLALPVVWNTGGYESAAAVDALARDVDVWLTDLKFYDPALSARLAAAPDYFAVAGRAVLRMAAAAGPPVYGRDGLLQRGLVVRLLILPGHWRDAARILRWLAEQLPPDGFVLSLMRQYTPPENARLPGGGPLPAALGRRLASYEYRRVLQEAQALGLCRGYTQQAASADAGYVPAFNGTGVF